MLLLSWLFFCFFVRFKKLGDGRNVWFRIRWWISRLDICFATRHWLDDQKVVKKRKTELGGTFSIASWILFIGLFAALLYQILSKRSIEVHNVRAINAPDLASFNNDLEFNITTVSSMSCSNLRGLGTLITGSPGLIDQRVVPLSTFANYSCQNTSKGPTISLRCNNCQLIQDILYISWRFVDLPDNPASAVGFQFILTAKNRANKKHLSFVSATIKNGSYLDDTPVTFRGVDASILKFNLFPRIYRNLHDLKLIQPLLHEFLPGSSFRETRQLQASFESSNNGLIATTLYVNFLSAYVIEIDNQNMLGLVSFLADLGGLYCVSIGIFFYFLVQCEYRIKRLRNEDSVLRGIRNRRKAQEHWDKLRKYVMYTWGCSTLDDCYKKTKKGSCCTSVVVESFHRNGSSMKRGQQNRKDAFSFNKKIGLPSEKNAIIECTHVPHEVVDSRKKDGKQYYEGDASQPRAFSSIGSNTLPPPPSIDFKVGSEMNMLDIQKNLQNLYEYNVTLRDKFIAAQSMLDALSTRASSPAKESQT